MSDARIVAMATFPPRKEGMLQVVSALLPQCDKFYLYLNKYKEVPPELPVDDRLVPVLAGPDQELPDVGSHGKFYWLGKDPGYYLSVDDDIFYPPDYVEYLVAGVEKYKRRAIVGLHGGIYRVRPGGALPPGGFAKDHRTLYPYDKAFSKDMSVHILGAGVMACYPQALGLTSAVCTGPLDSGDDEDIALWAQRTRTPLIRLAGKNKWVNPNHDMWTRDPLHRRSNFLKGSDIKLREWKTWSLRPLPAAEPAPRDKHGRPLPESKRSPVQTKPVGPSFDTVLLTDEDRDFCNKILSSDALAAQIVDRIKRGVPTSVIRMSDGERAIMAVSRGEPAAGFLNDQNWLRRYGLMGANLRQVGADLLWAGKEADYLACTISGLFWNIFRVHPYFPERQQFIDQFYPQMWNCTDRVGAVLRAGPVLVLHREHARLAPLLAKKYGLSDIDGAILNSWQDHNKLLVQVKAHLAKTVLVSGGASGKPFCVRLAKETGKVVLDVGEALTGVWCL